jgi:hypothetical protein
LTFNVGRPRRIKDQTIYIWLELVC